MNKHVKGLLALVGAVVIVGGIGFALNSAIAADKIVVDKDGVSVKLSNVITETTRTGMLTSVNGGQLSEPTIYKMSELPVELEKLIAASNASTTSLMKVDGTFCFATFVTYKDKDVGFVDVPMAAECKSFPAGTLLGRVVSFAEDYTKEVGNTYKTQFQVLK